VIAFRQKGELIQPVLFFILVVTLFPLAMGPGPQSLQKLAPGILWVAAILSSLMGLERLFRDDYVDGSLEQQMLSGISIPLLSLLKVTVHWIISIVPLILISPLLALFLNLSVSMYWALLATLLLGTPIISLIGAIAVALTLSLNKGGILLALLLLPVLTPLLIFATAAVEAAALQLPYSGPLAMIAAILCFTLGTAPFAIAYALRVSHY
jgi:heme exporter protein B